MNEDLKVALGNARIAWAKDGVVPIWSNLLGLVG